MTERQLGFTGFCADLAAFRLPPPHHGWARLIFLAFRPDHTLLNGSHYSLHLAAEKNVRQ